MDTRRVLGRFLLALLALAAVGYVAGADHVVAAVADADAELAAYALGSSVVAFVCFMEVFSRAASVVEPRGRRVRHTYVVGLFTRTALPWGNVANATVVSYLLSRDARTGYERALAAVAADEFVTTATSVVAVTVGAVLTATGGPDSQLAALATATAAAGLVFVAGVLAIAHARPRWLTDAVYAGAGLLQRVALRVSPTASSVLDRANVSARLQGFDRTVRDIATDRTRLAIMVGFGLLGWASLGVALHYAAGAVGVPLSATAAIAITPVAGLAAVLPLPGGVGSVDAALVGLVAAATGTPLAAAGAAAFVYRLVTFWLHFAVSAAVVAATPDALAALR